MTQLSSETIELRRLYEELFSTLTGTCGQPCCPPGLSEDSPPPPPPPPPTTFVH